MQKSGTAPAHNGAPFFSTNIWGSSNSGTRPDNPGPSHSRTGSRSRPVTSSGDREPPHGHGPSVASKDRDRDRERERDRKPSFGRKASFGSPGKGKRRASSASSNGGGVGGEHIKTDASAPPALPDFALASAAKFSSNEPVQSPPPSADSISRPPMGSHMAPVRAQGGFYAGSGTAISPPVGYPQAIGPPTEAIVHQHIHEIANKRISTLDYLRKAYVSTICSLSPSRPISCYPSASRP
jgi:hypothetical protein